MIRGNRGFVKLLACLKSKLKVLNHGRKSKQIITGILMVFLLTISIVIIKLTTIKTTEKFSLIPSTQQTQITPKVVMQNVLWFKIYGETGNDEGYCAKQTTDGGYIIAGDTSSYSAGSRDVWLIKIDENGTKEWDKTYGGIDYDNGRYVVQTADRGYIIAGYTQSYGAGYQDVWLIKTDENGNHQWNKTYGGTEIDRGHCIRQTKDGGFIIAGYTQSYGAGYQDVWLIKTDENGNHQWNKTYGGTEDDSGACIIQTSDEGYIIVGSTYSFSGPDSDIWLIKTNSTGEIEWNQTYGGTGNDYGSCVEQTTDGGYIIACEGDSWLIKTDTNGNILWNKTGGGVGRCVEQTIDGGYIILGKTSEEITLTKTDTNGTTTWSEYYRTWMNSGGGARSDWGNCVLQTNDGEYIVVGSTRPNAPFATSDVLLFKTDRNGYAPPFFDHPLPHDLVYEEGSIGNKISWHPRDNNPEMFDIKRNNTLLNIGSWNGGSITVSVDGLSVGTYIYSCTVYDSLGNSAIDDVTVTVIEASSPNDIETEFVDNDSNLRNISIYLAILVSIILAAWLGKSFAVKIRHKQKEKIKEEKEWEGVFFKYE